MSFAYSFPKKLVAVAIAREIFDLDYGNFKNQVQDDDLHAKYLSCWFALRGEANYTQSVS